MNGGPDPARVFSFFLDLVRIDSEPRFEGGVSEFIKAYCSETGLVFHEDGAGTATGGQSGNLVVRVPAGAFSTLPPVILNAHMDTVVPGRGVKPLDLEDRYMSTGETVLGADCKAGIAAILGAVDALLAAGGAYRALELVFTVQEENGLIGAKHLDRSLLDGEWGYVLDGSGPVGGIVIEAPGRYSFRFTINGKAAHAGVEPEKGRNSIACAARAVARLRLGRHDERTTANVGLIGGGSAVNIVPELTVVEGEVRSHSDEALEAEKARWMQAFEAAAEETGCELVAEVDRSFDRFSVDLGSTPVKVLERAMKDCGIEPVPAPSGGGSDANVLNKTGLDMVTINIGLVNAHSKQECITKKDLLDLSRIVFRTAYVAAGG